MDAPDVLCQRRRRDVNARSCRRLVRSRFLSLFSMVANLQLITAFYDCHKAHVTAGYFAKRLSHVPPFFAFKKSITKKAV